jgi:hypothetical protein
MSVLLRRLCHIATAAIPHFNDLVEVERILVLTFVLPMLGALNNLCKVGWGVGLVIFLPTSFVCATLARVVALMH